MTKILGIDEAGRGPVIGPMVISGALINEAEDVMLKTIGVKDSKLIAPGKRTDLFKKIKTIAKKTKILEVSPKEIDDTLASENLNLNWLEAIKSAEIINELKPDIVYIDCPSNNINDYTNYVKNLVKNKKTKIICEHKADEKYLCVGAASILSKVTRDSSIEKIKKKIRQDFGSGYPSDPITRIFLQKNYNNFPKIFRHSWSSYKEVSEKSAQKSLSDF